MGKEQKCRRIDDYGLARVVHVLAWRFVEPVCRARLLMDARYDVPMGYFCGDVVFNEPFSCIENLLIQRPRPDISHLC